MPSPELWVGHAAPRFITLLGVAAVAWPLAARAPQPARTKRSAIVHPATKVGDMNALAEVK